MVLQSQKHLSKSSELKDYEVSMSGAISTALCYINRTDGSRRRPGMNNSEGGLKVHKERRILVISASEDSPSQYVSIMNCIFAAVKEEVVIDGIILQNQD